MKLNKSDACGTSLMGYLTTDYATLTGLFGHPHMSDGDKVTAEWCFEAYGTVFTIYDYKEEKTPLDLYAWHVGGENKSALVVLREYLALNHVNDLVESYQDHTRRIYGF